jgi:superkiller protein 3
MSQALTLWDQDFRPHAEEAYRAFLNPLRWEDKFGVQFVQCSPAGAEQLIKRVKVDLSDKNIEVLRLDQPINRIYELIEELTQEKPIDILFVKGLEYSLYDYEEVHRQAGWTSEDTYNYSERSIPRILNHFNLQRERLFKNFKLSLVLLLPPFGIKYFIHRAPDFFDWRSGTYKFESPQDYIFENLERLVEERWEEYEKLSVREREERIADIQELIAQPSTDSNLVVKLLIDKGRLLASGKNYAEAISSLDRAIEHKPSYHEAWNGQGFTLGKLGRLEEAIASLDRAIEHKPDYHYAWNNRGNALGELGRLEEAISSYNKAIEHKPDYHKAWYGRGVALGQLGRLEEAISSFDKAIEHKPDYHEAWYNRGVALGNLGRLEEAISSYDKAIEHKPDFHHAWYTRGFAVYELGRLEEAISSYDKAIEHKPDKHEAWYNRGVALGKLGRWEEAISSFDKAIEHKPDFHEAWYNRGVDLGQLGRWEEVISSYDKAIEHKPDFHEAWYNRGFALGELGRLEEAISSYDKAIEHKPDYPSAWYNKARYYALQNQLEPALAHLRQAISLNPQSQNMAKTNTDFDSIRHHPDFQALIQ